MDRLYMNDWGYFILCGHLATFAADGFMKVGIQADRAAPVYES